MQSARACHTAVSNGNNKGAIKESVAMGNGSDNNNGNCRFYTLLATLLLVMIRGPHTALTVCHVCNV